MTPGIGDSVNESFIAPDFGRGSDAYTDLRNDVQHAPYAHTWQRMPDAEALLYTHPEYDEYIAKWEKYHDCYDANDMYKYVHRHMRETDPMFDQRVKRSYYFNYVASIVDLYVAYIYHPPILRALTAKEEQDFAPIYEDADLAGVKYSDLIMDACCLAQICGHCGVLVDSPKSPPEGFLTEQDRIDAGQRPYLTIIHPNQIKDWSLDRFGLFNWVKLEVQRPQERAWNETEDITTRHFLIWSRDGWEEWRLANEEAKLVDSGPNPLGVVPLVIVRNDRLAKHRWFGLSAVRDIVDINLAILNWCSLGDEEIYERCLNILTMERGESDMPAELSHHNVLEYDPGANPPQYLHPADTPLALIQGWIDRAREEIYRLAKLGGTAGRQNVKRSVSGIAYAFEFNETNQSLQKKASAMEQAETEIHRLLARWKGRTFEGSVTYPKEFGVDDFTQEIAFLAECRTTLSSGIAIKAIETKTLMKLFAADSEKLRRAVTEEVEESDPKMVSIPPQLRPSFESEDDQKKDESKDSEKDEKDSKKKEKKSSDTSKAGKATSAE